MKEKMRPQPKKKPDKDSKFLDFVRGLPCCVCGKKWEHGIHPHHVKSRGAGGGDVDNVVPLCVYCHVGLHQIGKKKFGSESERDLEKIALSVWKQYHS